MNGVGQPLHHSHLHPGATAHHLHHQMHHHDGTAGDDLARNFGSPNGRQTMASASSTSSPNEHLYSSLYGREMELMRKMFKANEKMDPADVSPGTGSYHGSMRGGPGNNFGPYSSPIFGGNAAKYFEGLSAAEQAKFAMGSNAAAGAGIPRPDLFEHNVHSSNSGSHTIAGSKSHTLMGGLLKPTFDEKHFGMNFSNNNNNNIMNPNHNLSESSLASNNNNNHMHNNHNHKYGGGGSFATPHLTSPTSTDSGGTAASISNTTTNNSQSTIPGVHHHNNHHNAMMMGDQFGSHNLHTANFLGSTATGGQLDKELTSAKGIDFETRKAVDDAKALAKLGAKLDDHFLDDELKTRLGQHLAASLMGSSHHTNSHHGHLGNQNNISLNNSSNISNNTSNDDDEDDEFTSL